MSIRKDKVTSRKQLITNKKRKIARRGPESESLLTTWFEIVRPVRHLENGESFYRVSFKDVDGNRQRADLPRKLFSKPREAASALLDAHAAFPMSAEDQKQAVADALAEAQGAPTLTLTKRLGWHGNADHGYSFVYFDKTFGPGRSTIELDPSSINNSALGKRAGTLTDWIEGLREPCLFSNELVMALGIAASGPVYSIIGNPEPAIYHFQGAKKPPGDKRKWKSSSGKTLTARAAQSMIGACDRTNLFGFNMTPLAVEETCFTCNNTVVVIDEEGAAGETGDGKSLPRSTLPYRIVAGQGRRRSKAYSVRESLTEQSWVVPVITTSEDELDSTKSVRKEGAQARMVAIPFAPSWQGGTFANAESPDKRNELAGLVEKAISTNYGVAMPKYLKHLSRDYAALRPDIIFILNKFVTDVGAATDAWEKRYAEKFGIVLAGALLLNRYGFAPWTEDRAREAITAVYRASRSQTVSISEATNNLLAKLKTKVKNEILFPRIEKSDEGSIDDPKRCWGVVRTVGGKKGVTLLRRSRFEKLVQPSAVADLVLKELDARGLLVKGPNGSRTRQVLIGGLREKRVRYICIRKLLTGQK